MAGVRRLASAPRPTIVAGRIQRLPGRSRQSSIELYDRVFFLRQDVYAGRHGFGVTATLLVPADAFGVAGLFDGRLKSGGDAEWSQRAGRRGFTIQYADEVTVAHPTLNSVTSLIAKSRRITGGHVTIQRRRPHAERVSSAVTSELRAIGEKWRLFRSMCPHRVFKTDMKLAGLIVLLQLVRAAERVRLASGGQPTRQ